MTYRIQFHREGAIIGEVEGLADRASAKRFAEAEIVEREADTAVVIDVTGPGTKVASIRQDMMMWDDE